MNLLPLSAPRREISAMLAAAPVREEGGAVSSEVLFRALRNYNLSNMSWEDDPHVGYPLVDLMSNDGTTISTGEEEMRILADHLAAALATREEAPADALACQSCGGEIQGWTCQGCGLSFTEINGRLRAQPQAREEAQPEAVEDEPWPDSPVANAIHALFQQDFCLDNEEASTATGDVLKIIDNHTPPAPEAEKLRAAVEALKPFAALADKFGCWSVVEVCAPDPGNPSPVIQPLPLSAFEKAAQALTALQQKGQ
ncbi:MAG: hypothetical protein P0Y52_07720 [Candidatus Brevundimonas phytovorans]|nr:hypothetical protein [Brevundimonas sp.]WEK59413.1 MAG: hypothetical protein P0Y52_07720 [Brevundimonas sp.]